MTRLLSPSVLSWLRCFDAAARHGSFTRAAEDLFITQGAVSQQVKQLEQWLGKPLLLRTPRALVLTPEGKWLSVVLRESLQAVESVLEDLRQVADEQTVVVMSSTPSFTMTWLTPRLGSFFRAHPQIGLRIQAEFHAIDRAGMQREGLDAALRFDLGEYTDLHAVAFLDEWLVPVASAAFLAEHPGLRSPRDLTGAMLLHDYSPWYRASAQQEWAHWFHQMKVPAPDFAAGHTYNLAMLAQSAAVTGQGVALGHVAHVLDDIVAGRLVPLFGQRVRSQASYFFICPSSRDDRLRKVEQWLHVQADAFRVQRQPLLETLAVVGK